MTNDLVGITFAYSLLLVASSVGVVVLKRWMKLVSIFFTCLALFMLEAAWQPPPIVTLTTCIGIVVALAFASAWYAEKIYLERMGKKVYIRARH